MHGRRMVNAPQQWLKDPRPHGGELLVAGMRKNPHSKFHPRLPQAHTGSFP